MARELTRRITGRDAGARRLEIEVSKASMAVRVTLSGFLDAGGLLGWSAPLACAGRKHE